MSQLDKDRKPYKQTIVASVYSRNSAVYGKMSTKSASVGSIKKGSYLLVDGAPCKCVDVQISKAGKHGHAKSKITCVGVLDGKKRIYMSPVFNHRLYSAKMIIL